MPVHNVDIVGIFNEIADLLEIQGANVFRVRAYRDAARTIEGLGREVRDLVAQGEDLQKLPGIGKDLDAKIKEIVATGGCAALEKLHGELPAGLVKLLAIAGLGPKKVRALYLEGIQTLEQLRQAALDQKLRALAGFGEKTEAHLLAALDTKLQQTEKRYRLDYAAQYAEPLVQYLKKCRGVKQVAMAGSYRRGKEEVGDLDILVTADPNSRVMEHFVEYDEVGEVLAKGATRATVVLRSGLQVDVRVVAAASYGAALHYFTGSKAHNIEIRRLGQQHGLKINEYGVFRGEERLAGATEESVFAAVELPFIPPELRENRGEIEAARAGRLPKLVELADLRGDLHAHTRNTDGHNTIEEMAEAAWQHGFEYLAITEHSRRLAMARGLDPDRLLRQIDEIDRFNEQRQGITVLKGIEVDILEDGSLDLPDELLAKLDLVVAAVHSRFGLSRRQQTERLLRAMDHPHFSILAHPSGRLLQSRPPYEVDMAAVIRKAGERRCFLELNAHPERLDLSDIYCQMAKEAGVLISINSDAHRILDFNFLRFGVGQARRGWLAKKDVLNTRPLAKLRQALRATM